MFQMAYFIVEFLEDILVDVVPLSWVNDGQCAWPSNLKGDRVTSLVKKGVPPDPLWKRYSVAVKGAFGKPFIYKSI